MLAFQEYQEEVSNFLKQELCRTLEENEAVFRVLTVPPSSFWKAEFRSHLPPAHLLIVS